jgi:uncharacterized iron-regulated membrane protein
MPKAAPTATALSWRRILFTVHLWLGLGSGILFCLVCCSGFFLALHPQVEARIRARALVASPEALMPTDRLMTLAIKAGSFDRIDIPASATSPWKLRGPEGNLYINPQSGAVLGSLWGDAYNTVEKLHRFLLLESKTGKAITGAAAIIYLVMMGSGLVMWLDRFRRQPRRGLLFKSGSSWKRRFYDAHLVLGVYALLPLTLMAATGLYWSYREPYRAALYRVLDGVSPPAAKPEQKGKKPPVRTDLPYAALLAKVAEQQAGPASIRLQMPRQGQTTVTISTIRPPGFWRLPVKNEYLLDIDTAQVVERKLFADKSRAEKAMSLLFDIHSGAAWGDISLVLWLLATAMGASLPISGTVMWWNRMKGQRAARDILARRRSEQTV